MTVLLLKHFIDVLRASLKNKNFTYHIVHNEKVPEKSLELWKNRATTQQLLALHTLNFRAKTKEFTYPAFIWSE